MVEKKDKHREGDEEKKNWIIWKGEKAEEISEHMRKKRMKTREGEEKRE